MAKGHSVGTIYAEVDLSFEPFTKAQKNLLKDVSSTTLNVEKNFKDLGIKSAKEFDLMRLKIENAFNRIKNSSKVTADDIVRAEKAKADKIRQINEQQFGHQTSLLTSLKSHYIAISAAIYASIRIIEKGWTMVREAAEFTEQEGILDNLAMKYNATADSIVSKMAKASDEMISNVNLMQVALSGLSRGLNPEQLINLADAAKILGDSVGVSTTEALKSLTEALETGRVRGIDKYMTGTIDLEEKFGDLTSKLTPTEKAQALYNLVMIEAIDRQNQQSKAVDDTADKMDRLTAKWDNLKLSISTYFKEAAVWVSEGHMGNWLWEALHPEDADNNNRFGPQRRKIVKPKSAVEYKDTINQMKETLKLKEDVEKQLSGGSKTKKESGRSFGLIDLAWAQDEEMRRVYESNLEIQKEFNLRYEELEKNQFDMDRLQVQRQSELWKQAGADKVKVAEYTAKRLNEISRLENEARLSFYADTAGGIAETFRQIAQAGGKYSKKAFEIYKAAAMAEAAISMALAISKAIASGPPPWNIIAAAVSGAAAAVQIATIARSQPPSYDQGGVSNAGGLYRTGNIQEAHVPIPKGKIPVEINGGGGGTVVEHHYHIEGNTFYDKEKQAQVFAQIAELVAWKVTPQAYAYNYSNDGVTRRIARGGG